MKKYKYLTDRELLAELEERLPEFGHDKFMALMKLITPYQEKVIELLHAINPQLHNWIQEKKQQLEQEKTDKEVEKIRKSLENKKDQ